MRDIRRPDAMEPVVERLTERDKSNTDQPIFETIMRLMVFCAGVGFTTGKSSDVPSSGKAVPYRIFENNQMDGYLFLLALAESKDPSILAGARDDEIAGIFERYAAGGLEEINSWLNANPTDTSGIQALITRIQSLVKISTPVPSNPSPL